MGTLPAFAADLAARSDAGLRQLLAFRPDAMDPPVPNFAALAARLSTAASISLALDALNLPQLQTLAALAHTPGVGSPGMGSPLAAGLHARGLLISQTDDAGILHYIPLTAVGPFLGKGLPGGASGPGVAALPNVSPPAPVLAPVLPAVSRNAAGSAADSLLRTVDTLATLAGLAPLPALRNGNPSLRSVRTVARELGTDEAQSRFFLALAAAAGLLTFNQAGRVWEWTASWSRVEPQEQWVHLVRSWLAGRSAPMDAGPADPQLRVRLLATLAALTEESAPDGQAAGAPSPGSVRETYLWRHPRTTEPDLATLPGLLAEAELLGLTGAGALSAPGRAAADNEWAAAAASVSTLLPEAIDYFVIQGDLTAIAPARLLPGIAAQLRALAVQEGRGTAGIFRFSEASLAAATAGGLHPGDILDFLRNHCRTAVPQSLEYLVGEAGRAHSGGTDTRHLPARAETAANPARVPFPPARLPAPPAPPAKVPAFTGGSAGVVPSKVVSAAPTEVAAQLALLRSSPVWPDAGQGETGPAMVLEKLRRAVELGVEVRLQAVDGVGETEQVTALPVEFTEGLLRTRSAGRERRFSVHRILAVEVLEPVPDGERNHG